MFGSYSVHIISMSGQCTRCEMPLVRRSDAGDPSFCRPCLRTLDADISTKRQILFSAGDGAGESLSACA